MPKTVSKTLIKALLAKGTYIINWTDKNTIDFVIEEGKKYS